MAVQAEATQAALERQSEEANAAELRIRELQVWDQSFACSNCSQSFGSLFAVINHLPTASQQTDSCLLLPVPPNADMPPGLPSAQVRAEQQMRALEAREAELRAIEVGLV